MLWVRIYMAWWQNEQKAAGTERNLWRGWQQKFQNYDVTYTAVFVFKRCISSSYITSICLSILLSPYSILFYWAEKEGYSVSRVSLLWQRSLEIKLSFSKWKRSLRWKLPSNQVTDIYLIPSVAGLSLKLPKSTLISLDPSKRWTVMAFNQRRLWFLKTSANTEISACVTVTYSCASVAEDENAAGILTVSWREELWRNKLVWILREVQAVVGWKRHHLETESFLS